MYECSAPLRQNTLLTLLMNGRPKKVKLLVMSKNNKHRLWILAAGS